MLIGADVPCLESTVTLYTYTKRGQILEVKSEEHHHSQLGMSQLGDAQLHFLQRAKLESSVFVCVFNKKTHVHKETNESKLV